MRRSKMYKGKRTSAGTRQKASEKARDALYRRGLTSKAAIVEQLGEQAVKDAITKELGTEVFSRNYEPVVKWSHGSHKAGSPGVPVFMLSDIHYGEVVDREQVYGSNEYNVEICKARVKHTVQVAVSLLKTHFAKPNYPGIVLVLGGDMISGQLHDDLIDMDEGSPLIQAMGVAQIVTDAIKFLAEEFKRVDIYCVPGNHGRTTRKPRAKFYAHYNLDWLSYQLIAKYTERMKRVTVNAPNARDLTFNVAGHRYRLTHGDQFRGGDGIIGPLGPIIRGDVKKRVTASLMPGQPEAYDTMLCGHFHTLHMLPRLIVNGSVKGYDEYAMSINCPWEPPQQALWTVHPKHGQTWYMPVLCDKDYTAHGIRT